VCEEATAFLFASPPPPTPPQSCRTERLRASKQKDVRVLRTSLAVLLLPSPCDFRHGTSYKDVRRFVFAVSIVFFMSVLLLISCWTLWNDCCPVPVVYLLVSRVSQSEVEVMQSELRCQVRTISKASCQRTYQSISII
jgi:hypothetical protein